MTDDGQAKNGNLENRGAGSKSAENPAQPISAVLQFLISEGPVRKRGR
jgi:hypothetical protein